MRELLRRIDSHELTEWQCYFALEPWGEERADFRAGTVASVIANVNRDPQKRREPFSASDFMPRFLEPEEPKPVPSQTQAAYFQLLTSINAAKQRKAGRR